MGTTTATLERISQSALFELDAATAARREAFESRLRAFARAVATRHRSGRADVNGLLTALHGYHSALRQFALEPVPPLDDAAVRVALDAYVAAAPGRRRAA